MSRHTAVVLAEVIRQKWDAFSEKASTLTTQSYVCWQWHRIMQTDISFIPCSDAIVILALMWMMCIYLFIRLMEFNLSVAKYDKNTSGFIIFVRKRHVYQLIITTSINLSVLLSMAIDHLWRKQLCRNWKFILNLGVTPSPHHLLFVCVFRNRSSFCWQTTTVSPANFWLFTASG